MNLEPEKQISGEDSALFTHGLYVFSVVGSLVGEYLPFYGNEYLLVAGMLAIVAVFSTTLLVYRYRKSKPIICVLIAVSLMSQFRIVEFLLMLTIWSIRGFAP